MFGKLLSSPNLSLFLMPLCLQKKAHRVSRRGERSESAPVRGARESVLRRTRSWEEFRPWHCTKQKRQDRKIQPGKLYVCVHNMLTKTFVNKCTPVHLCKDQTWTNFYGAMMIANKQHASRFATCALLSDNTRCDTKTECSSTPWLLRDVRRPRR